MLIVVSLFLITNLNALTYTESSTGLIPPEMDGGRTELEFVDINDDGNIDILSIGDHGSPNVGTSQHGIMVWFGDGSGTWSVYQNGNFGYGGIAIGDVNNDGLKDVGYAMHHDYSGTDLGDQLMEVALGDGTGMNWIPWDDGLATNGETWGMFGTDFADVNNDGSLDIGSNSFGASAGVHVYINQGDGTWVQSFGFVGGNSTMDFCFGDINNDGNADFTVNHQYGTIYFGDGTGDFTLADCNLPSMGSMGRYGTSLGDVDNDGGKDLAYINNNGGIELWVWDEVQEQWIDFSGTLPTSGSYQSTQLCDMNADGYVDVCAFGNGTFTLWLGNGAGVWTQDAQFTTPPVGDSEAFRVGGDIDHNGYPDIAMVTDEGSWPSYQNYLHCYKETSTANSLSITPVFPNGGNKFYKNSSLWIYWISGVPAGGQSTVKLEYSYTGSNGPWICIADNLPNNDSYQWLVPDVNSDNCYIRYTVQNLFNSITAKSPCPFTIMGGSVAIDNEDNWLNTISIQNYPNPFHAITSISFTLKASTNVSIFVYNIRGQLVDQLYDGLMAAGEHWVEWNAEDLSPGLYLCSLVMPEQRETIKMIVIK